MRCRKDEDEDEDEINGSQVGRLFASMGSGPTSPDLYVVLLVASRRSVQNMR